MVHKLCRIVAPASSHADGAALDSSQFPELFSLKLLIVQGSQSMRNEYGHCFCGTIVAEMSGEPFWICYDHDDDCRRAIGGPITIWIGYRPREVRFQKGHPKGFSKTRGVTRYFCGDSGTSIAYVDKGLPNEIYVSVCFMDNPERFPPGAQAYWECGFPSW